MKPLNLNLIEVSKKQLLIHGVLFILEVYN